MEKHALAVLQAAELCDWPVTQYAQAGGGYRAITPHLLSCFITESNRLDGTLLDHFWLQLENCSPMLKKNIEHLRDTPFNSADQTLQILFEGVNRATLNFDPIFKIAADLFIHLGVPFTDSAEHKSERSTRYSASNDEGMETCDPTEMAAHSNSEEALTALSFKRDGTFCPVTGVLFAEDHYDPGLTCIVPISIRDKSDTLELITLIAGSATKDDVLRYLNSHYNTLNLELNTRSAFDKLRWGIEAQADNGTVRYIYRRIPYNPKPGPGYVRMQDGDEIKFGGGSEGPELGHGPSAALCNLQLAVARALNLSGAAKVIAQMRDDADDSDLPHVFIASNHFCDILTAKLLLNSAPALII